MNIRLIGLVGILAVAGIVGYGVIGDTGFLDDGTSTSSLDDGFSLLISDAPAAIGDFGSLTIPFDRAEITREDGTTKTVQLNGSVVDLTKVIGDTAVPILSTTLEEGNYSSITLYVQDELDMNGGGTTLVSGTSAADGSEVAVLVASGKLQINKNFTIDHTTKSSDFNLSENSTTYSDAVDQKEQYVSDDAFETSITNSTVNGSTVTTVIGQFQTGLNFVFDIHVVKTGSDKAPSGVGGSPMDYVLTPNLADSGVVGQDVPEQTIPDEANTTTGE